MMRGGECWELSMPALLTSGKESGLWATPTASTGGPEPEGKTGRKLVTQVKLWPTITVCGNYNRKGASANSGDGLATAVAMYPTPMASEARQGYQNRRNGKKGSQESLTTVIQGGPANQVGGSLNPSWVAWLMGWPIEWTDCAASATDRFRQWCASHGISSDRL
jgi:hypothetical protein